MSRLAALIITALLVVFASIESKGAERQARCLSTEAFNNVAEGVWGEELRVSGIGVDAADGSRAVMQLWVGRAAGLEGRSWSIAMVLESGITCLLASGNRATVFPGGGREM